MVQQHYTRKPATPTATRRRCRSGQLPLRIYLVLKYLRAVCPAGQSVNLSNAAICQGVSYGSEGEVSQILRWLAGELPTAGRWSHRYLDAPQRLRYLRRERRPDGGYTTIVLQTPEPIALADPVTHDPSGDGPDSAPASTPGGIMHHDPSEDSPSAASERAPASSKRDHAINRESNQDDQQQQDAHARDPIKAPEVPGASFPIPWQAIQRANPGCTHADFFDALAKAQTRHGIDVTDPLRLTVKALLRGEPIYSLQELEQRAAPLVREAPNDRGASARPDRRRDRKPPDQDFPARSVSAADLEQAAALRARVRAIEPPDADDDDIGSLIIALRAGATDSEALAQMQADRATRLAQPPSNEVYDALRAHTRARCLGR